MVPKGIIKITPELLGEKSQTFIKRAGTPFSADIELAFQDGLHAGYELRIWKVL